MRIGIITPVYRAWDMVEKCLTAVNINTENEFIHVMVNDASPDTPPWFCEEANSVLRKFINVPDTVPPDKHKARITTMLQVGYDALRGVYGEGNQSFDRLFVIESDVIVKKGWDAKMLEIASCFERDEHPIGWNSLEAYAVDEQGRPTYPMPQNPPLGEYHLPDTQHHLQVTRFNDWNCILFNPKVLALDWKFSDVLSHHDIMLSRKIQKITGWPNFRTKEVEVIHYAGSSRGMLPTV